MSEIEKSKDISEPIKAPHTDLEQKNLDVTNEMPNDQPPADNTSGPADILFSFFSKI